MHKIVEKCRSGDGGRGTGGGRGVDISYNPTFCYTGPWHARIAITFFLFYIFTCGFLQRFKHRLHSILSFVLSQGNSLVLSQDATFSFVTGVVGVGALARARKRCGNYPAVSDLFVIYDEFWFDGPLTLTPNFV